jgi:hypothetical protein
MFETASTNRLLLSTVPPDLLESFLKIRATLFSVSNGMLHDNTAGMDLDIRFSQCVVDFSFGIATEIISTIRNNQ